MSTARDTSHLTDISKMKTEPDGSFKRKASTFRDFIEKGGKFEPEKGRYHLYVSYACPWATRALIVRKIKGLEEFIDVSVVSPRMGAQGWPFANADAFPGADVDPLHNAEHVKDLYMRAQPDYEGRYDKKTSTIVNNESSELIRMFNTAFNDQLPADKAAIDLYPEPFRKEIDEVNEWMLDTLNHGVYKTGFATTQEAYEAAVVPLFESLDRLEMMLTGRDYLLGDKLTEADVRLFVTIVRFDPVYFGHFKCNMRTIRGGYPAIHLWLRKLYWNNTAFSETCHFDHIKTHYHWSHPNINPSRIIPIGPVPNILPL
ncbi:glutathione S-transferase [Lenzites betulinus]|nr:glutathione S-transferase [Lenzites betulinus]